MFMLNKNILNWFYGIFNKENMIDDSGSIHINK